MLRYGRRHLPVLLIIAVVVIANEPYLFGPFRSSPALLYSGQGVHVGGAVLAGDPSIDPNYGFMSQALGHRAIEDLLHGHIPWWNPYEGIGMPLAGNMQSAALFPLVVLELVPWGLLLSHVILEAAAGVATYLLLRRLRLSTAPAVAAGAAFALNGTFSWLAHAPVNVVATLPMVLLGVEMARDAARDTRTGGWVLLALGLALSIYAGFPETAFIDGLLAVLWAAARLPGLGTRRSARLAAKLAGGAVTAALLAAPLLVAFLDNLQGADVGGHGGALANAAIPATGAAQLGMPYYLGPIFGYLQNGRPSGLFIVWGNTGGYLSIAVVMLALIGAAGVYGRPYRALRAVLAGWALVCSARIFGAGWALGLINLIPGVSRTAFYRYCPPTVELALVVLAALGVEDLGSRPLRSRAAWLAGAAGGSAAIVAVLVRQAAPLTSLPGSALAPLHLWREASVGWALFSVAAVAAAGLLRSHWRKAALGAFLSLDAVVLFAVPEFSAPRHGSLDTAPIAYLERHLGQQRVYAMDGALQANYGSYFGVAEINDNDLPVPGLWARYVSTRLDPNADPLTFTGFTRLNPDGPSAEASLLSHLDAYRAASVRYVLVPAVVALPPPLVKVWSDPQTAIFRIPGADPLFQTVGSRCGVRAGSPDTATVDCTGPATLVRRVLDEPGWQASAGGGTLAISSYGGAFQAVHLPPGRSTVRFSFRPPHLPLGEAAWLAGWAVVAVGAVTGRRRSAGSHSGRRSRRPSAVPTAAPAPSSPPTT